jgi:hypothetical protein
MGTNVAKIAPLPVPMPTNPVPALPAWVTKLHENLRENLQLDPATGKFVEPLTLATMPTDEQVAGLERHAAQCRDLLDQCPDNDEGCAKRTFGLISKLLMAKPGRVAGPETVKARIEAYEIALGDVPTWALQLAIRKWLRGECDLHFSNPPETYDYTWAPEGAILRKIAMREVRKVRERLQQIDRVITAVPLRDDSAILERNRLAGMAAMAGKARGMEIDEAAEVGRQMVEAIKKKDDTARRSNWKPDVRPAESWNAIGEHGDTP